MRIADTFHGERFFVVQQGLRYATPLFVVLVLVEVTDLIFAVDSIPAIFAVTGDPFIVFTSNIFAILGLRAMYFLLADMAQRFHLLKYGLAGILIFIGAKMLLLDVYKIPTAAALGVVGLSWRCRWWRACLPRSRRKGPDCRLSYSRVVCCHGLP
jgi:tellurite resistance protein TerC